MSATTFATPPPAGGFVKASAIARLYNITPHSIYKWAKSGKIPSVTFEGTVRFDVDAVRSVIEGRAL